MNKPLFQLIGVHFKEFFREPEVLFWSFVFPIAIAAVLGIAFTNQSDTEQIVAVVQEEHIDMKAFPVPESDTSNLRFQPMSYQEAVLAMKRGAISLYLAPDSISQTWKAYYDPNNTEARLIYLTIKNQLSTRQERPQLPASYITTPGNRYIDFLVPGLIALGIMNSCLWGIGWSLVEFRIKKLMRRMVATPMRRSTFLLSYIVTRTILAFLEAFIVYWFAHFAFGVTIQGNVPALLLTFIAGVAAFAGIAVLVSSRAQHTQVGNGLINAVVLPMTILSGIFFSYQRFPEWAVGIIEYLPLTMLADTLRAVFIEAASLGEVGWKLLLLCFCGILCFIAGLRIYKWY